MEAGLIYTNDCVEAIIKFGSGALDDDADKRAATVELLGRAAPASLAEAIERMRDNGDTLVAHTIGTVALTVCALRGVPWQP